MGNGSMVVVIGICVYAVFILGLGLLKKTDGKNFVNVGGGIGSFALVCSMFISIILVVFIVPYAALQMVASAMASPWVPKGSSLLSWRWSPCSPSL